MEANQPKHRAHQWVYLSVYLGCNVTLGFCQAGEDAVTALGGLAAACGEEKIHARGKTHDYI